MDVALGDVLLFKKRGCTLSVKQALDRVFAQTAFLNPPMHSFICSRFSAVFHRRGLEQILQDYIYLSALEEAVKGETE